jgi:hypothetical protein
MHSTSLPRHWKLCTQQLMAPPMPLQLVAIELTGLNDIQVKLEISAGIRSHRHSGQLLGPRQMDNADHCAEAYMVITGFATPSAYVEASCRTT